MKSHTGADTGYRIQDLSEGGARFISEPKIPYLKSKKRDAGKKIFKIDIFFCFRHEKPPYPYLIKN